MSQPHKYLPSQAESNPSSHINVVYVGGDELVESSMMVISTLEGPKRLNLGKSLS